VKKLLYKGLQCIGGDYGRCVLEGWVATIGVLTQGSHLGHAVNMFVKRGSNASRCVAISRWLRTPTLRCEGMGEKPLPVLQVSSRYDKCVNQGSLSRECPISRPS